VRIAFLVASVSRRAGGLFESVRKLALSFVERRSGVDVTVLALGDPDTAQDLPEWRGLPVFAGRVLGPRTFGYSPELARRLAGETADLVHLHGLWMYPSVACSRWAASGRGPYLVSPHGMLDAWAIRNSAWKKRVTAWLFERRNLRGATCLHALSEAEAESIRACGLRNPVCVIPNGVELPVERPASHPGWVREIPAGAKVLLFLGRLHPKKGVPALLKGWAAARGAGRDDWRLVIAGWEQGGHEAQLRRLVGDLGLSEQVRFVGPQFGREKAATLARASAFVLPSLSEGLPMAVLEAWAYGLPVLMTPRCNLAEGFAVGAALRVEPEAESLALGLEELFRMGESDRRAVGERGRRLVQERFSWPTIAGEMQRVYEWVLGAAAKPECVRSA